MESPMSRTMPGNAGKSMLRGALLHFFDAAEGFAEAAKNLAPGGASRVVYKNEMVLVKKRLLA